MPTPAAYRSGAARAAWTAFAAAGPTPRTPQARGSGLTRKAAVTAPRSAGPSTPCPGSRSTNGLAWEVATATARSGTSADCATSTGYERAAAPYPGGVQTRAGLPWTTPSHQVPPAAGPAGRNGTVA